MSIRLKTIIGIALIEGTLLLVLLVMMMDFIRESNYEALSKRANTTATLFATTTKDAVLSFDLASLESFVNEVMQNPDLVYARVVSDDGTPFAEAGDSSHQQTEIFRMDSDAHYINDDVYDISALIEEGGEVYGRVELGIHIGSINQAINKVYTWGLVLASGEMLLVALFSFLLGGYLTGQLHKLREAASAIAQGKLDTTVPVKGRDEVAVVGKAFNLMAANLHKASQDQARYEAELLDLNQTLESRVSERTEQLQTRNGQLEKTLKTLKNTQAKLLHSEKMAGLGTMAAGVAHEINNPVGFVKSNLGTLQTYTGDLMKYSSELNSMLAQTGDKQLIAASEEARKQYDVEYLEEDLPVLLSESLDGVTRVEGIVSGLKSFSRLDSDAMQPGNINRGIQDTLKVASNQLKYHCTIHEEYADLPELTCNMAQINQVVLNLLVNASHAIADKGDIYIRTLFKDNAIQIIVQDNGCGMSEEVIGQLFNPFFTTKEVGKGTGLGLSISHGIVEKHGGEIQVKSVVGKGTRFTVILPLEPVLPQSVTS